MTPSGAGKSTTRGGGVCCAEHTTGSASATINEKTRIRNETRRQIMATSQECRILDTRRDGIASAMKFRGRDAAANFRRRRRSAPVSRNGLAQWFFGLSGVALSLSGNELVSVFPRPGKYLRE